MDEARLWAELAAIRAEIAALREAVERGRYPPPRREPGALLRAVFEAVEGRSFSTFEIIDFVDVAQAEGLGKAIAAACGALSPRKLGKLLARLEGEEVDGHLVRRIGDSREGLRWRVSRVCSDQTPDRSARIA